MGEAVAPGVIEGVDRLIGGFALVGLGAHLVKRPAGSAREAEAVSQAPAISPEIVGP